MRGRIIGTGSYLPERVMTNHDLESLVDTTDEWIKARTGIEKRHIAAEGETTCDIGEKAARKAIEASGLSANDIDLIIFATTTPDLVFPSTACLLQKRLGIHGSPAFDVQAVCTGFVYAMDIANRFIQTGGAKNVLIVGAETLSRILNWSDRGTCILFGDGAGAVVMSADEKVGMIESQIHADGEYESLLKVTAGVGQDYELLKQGEAYITMQGNEVFKMAVNTLGLIVDEVLEATPYSKEDIDWLVPHQANIRIIQATAKKLNMSMDNVVVTVNQHGNTSAASIPLALDVAVREGKIKQGDKVLFEAFGGGFTWGASLVEF